MLEENLTDEDGASTCAETTYGGGASSHGSAGQRTPVSSMQMSQLMRDIDAMWERPCLH